MTLKIRWLSALVLLLAVGAVAVRAEEEEAPPPRPQTAELLPAPLPVPVDRPCVHVMPAALPAGVWSFVGAAQPPMPCPVPFMPAGFAPCGDGCGVCTVCPCPNCPLCSLSPAPEGGEYVVEMKMVEAGDDEPKVISHPRICVVEGQTGTVQVAAAGSKEQSTLQMQATLTKLDEGAVLDLCVMKASSFTPGNNVFQSHAETTQHRLPVQFGKATKLELTHDSDGACTSWVEVTVTKVETEARMPKTVGVLLPQSDGGRGRRGGGIVRGERLRRVPPGLVRCGRRNGVERHRRVPRRPADRGERRDPATPAAVLPGGAGDRHGPGPLHGVRRACWNCTHADLHAVRRDGVGQAAIAHVRIRHLQRPQVRGISGGKKHCQGVGRPRNHPRRRLVLEREAPARESSSGRLGDKSHRRQDHLKLDKRTLRLRSAIERP